VEGYVFNVDTGKPLANAIVLYQHFQQGTQNGLAEQGNTDSNGFYQITSQLLNIPEDITLYASCVTRRGTVRSAIAVYNPPRATIYRRDFYLKLPRHDSSCLQ
jgi:hypothetical protein